MKRLLNLLRAWAHDLWARLFAKRYTGFDCAGNGDYMTFISAYKTHGGRVVITELKTLERGNPAASLNEGE